MLGWCSILICKFFSFVDAEYRLDWSDLLGDFFSRLTSIVFFGFSVCWWIVSVNFLSRWTFFDPRNSISELDFDFELLVDCLLLSSGFLSVITIVRFGDLLYVWLCRISWSLRVSSVSRSGDIDECFLCFDDGIEWVSVFFLCLWDEWIYSDSDAELTGESLNKRYRWVWREMWEMVYPSFERGFLLDECRLSWEDEYVFFLDDDDDDFVFESEVRLWD